MAKLTQDEVLRYQKGRRAQATVKHHYINWRAEQNPPIPLRCDNKNCNYYTQPLVWNGAELKLILDHINGVCGDNRAKNLQFLCPNCNSQQSTHGGGNKGKVEQSSGGFAHVGKDGKKNYTLPAEPGKFKLTGGNAKFTITKKNA